MNKQQNSISDALHAEIKRCREVLTVFQARGLAGIYVVDELRYSLLKANKAISRNKAHEMEKAYKDLKGYKP